jgi:hypothetical protein
MDLPTRLGKTAAGQPLVYETVCAQHAVIGDSGHAITRLQELAQETGAKHFLAWMNIGAIPHPLVMESMEQFASEVMPTFQ